MDRNNQASQPITKRPLPVSELALDVPPSLVNLTFTQAGSNLDL